MTLYLIRHGKTDWNTKGLIQGCEDIPLNNEGRLQARAAAASFSNTGLDCVWTSPLSRARESAGIIAEHCGVQQVQLYDDLRERDFGESGGMTFAYRREHYPDEENIPGQESFPDLQKRALAALDYIAHTTTGQTILIVSHGAFIDSIVRHFTNTPWQGLSSIKLKNCSVSRLDYVNSSFSMPWHNQAPGDAESFF